MKSFELIKCNTENCALTNLTAWQENKFVVLNFLREDHSFRTKNFQFHIIDTELNSIIIDKKSNKFCNDNGNIDLVYSKDKPSELFLFKTFCMTEHCCLYSVPDFKIKKEIFGIEKVDCFFNLYKSKKYITLHKNILGRLHSYFSIFFRDLEFNYNDLVVCSFQGIGCWNTKVITIGEKEGEITHSCVSNDGLTAAALVEYPDRLETVLIDLE